MTWTLFQNVKSLLYASSLLEIDSAETACFNFLKATLNPANCVRHFVLADSKRSWNNLSSHCALFIQLNFDQLRRLTQVSSAILYIASANTNIMKFVSC